MHSRPRVLVVDDDPQMRQVLSETLRSRLSTVAVADCAEQAAGLIEAGQFDVVLLDVNLPGASGLNLLELAHRWHWDAAFILISGRPIMDGVITALRLHAADFLMKPVRAEALRDSVDKAYQNLVLKRKAWTRQQAVEAELQERSLELQTALQSMETNYSDTLLSLTTALDAREHATCAHSYRVRAYTSYLAQVVGYRSEDLRDLENAALLHDIGKIGIPDAILLKPDKLTAAETEVMKQHSVLGEQLMSKVAFLRTASPIVRHHHERFDGSGYPDGLVGEKIPYGSRLFAFADSLDAMTTSRCYRKTPGLSAVRLEIVRESGTQFDPAIAKRFLDVSDHTWRAIRGEAERAYNSQLRPSYGVVDHPMSEGMQLTQ